MTSPKGVLQTAEEKTSGLAKDTYIIRAPDADSRIKVVLKELSDVREFDPLAIGAVNTTISYLQLTGCENCRCDHVAIFDSGEVANPLGMLCDRFEDLFQESWFISDSNEVRIYVNADVSKGRGRYKIEYEILRPTDAKYDQGKSRLGTTRVHARALVLGEVRSKVYRSWRRVREAKFKSLKTCLVFCCRLLNGQHYLDRGNNIS